ncbi:hypothetical protein ACQKWADRAFT_91988 [Trichoderma austrokoningii]
MKENVLGSKIPCATPSLLPRSTCLAIRYGGRSSRCGASHPAMGPWGREGSSSSRIPALAMSQRLVIDLQPAPALRLVERPSLILTVFYPSTNVSSDSDNCQLSELVNRPGSFCPFHQKAQKGPLVPLADPRPRPCAAGAVQSMSGMAVYRGEMAVRCAWPKRGKTTSILPEQKVTCERLCEGMYWPTLTDQGGLGFRGR